MRIVGVLLLIALILSGCSSKIANSSRAARFNPANAFASLPSPAEAAARTASSDDALVLKTTSRVVWMEGDTFTEDPPSSNVEILPQWHQCEMYGQQLELTYCFYEIAAPVLTEEDQLTDLMVQFGWANETPTPPDGLWIGLPDYTNNRWVWRDGPITESNTWIDISDLGIIGNAGPEHFAAIAWAIDNVTLSDFYLQHVSEASPAGDEWIYYTHEDPDNPETIGHSISRVRPDGSDQQVIIAGDETNDASHPVFSTTGSDRLAYALNQGGWTEMWRCELDGSSPSLLASSDERDILPAAWSPDGSVSLTLRSRPTVGYNLFARDTGEEVNGLLLSESSVVYDAVWDPSGESFYSALVTVGYLGYKGIEYVREDGDLPIGGTPVPLLYNVAFERDVFEPAPYAIPDGNGQMHYGFLRADEGAFSFDLFEFHGAPDDDPLETYSSSYLMDHDYDLRSPAVSLDGTLVAFVAMEVGGEVGTLYVTDYFVPDLDTAIPVADHVVGDVIWYDPAP